jgi:hypothetical protein
MKRVSLIALLAVALGSTGCSCCRRNPPATVAACPAPAPMCPNPCAPGAVTYGYGSGGYGMPTNTYMAPMQ